MIKTQSKVDYYLIQNTLVDPDLAMKHRKIISENVVNGMPNLFTVTFNQVLQDFGVRNWNGRIYSDAVVMNAINTNPLIQNDLKMGTWSGEYGHPLLDKSANQLARQMTIHPPFASHTIDKYWKDGNLLMGTCTTLSGGYGDMLRDRILTGYPAMASSRAIGGVDKNGNVLPGYTVVTFDEVIRPSHKVAYQVKGSEHVNNFQITDGNMCNTMTESAIKYDYNENESLKDFLLTEASSRQKIAIVCDALHLNYDSMVLTENSLRIDSIDNGTKTTLIMPINKLISAEYHNLF